MKLMELRTADGRCIARNVRMACSFQARCVGLLRQSAVPEEEGLLLVPGGSIHTLGMRCMIDVVFLSRQMRVLGLAERVPPWRIRVAPRSTGRVLELAAGQIAATRLTVGTHLVVESTHQEPKDRRTCPTVSLGSARRPACERLPIQFSLRLPLEHHRERRILTKCSAGTRSKALMDEHADGGVLTSLHCDPFAPDAPAMPRPNAES